MNEQISIFDIKTAAEWENDIDSDKLRECVYGVYFKKNVAMCQKGGMHTPKTCPCEYFEKEVKNEG